MLQTKNMFNFSRHDGTLYVVKETIHDVTQRRPMSDGIVKISSNSYDFKNKFTCAVQEVEASKVVA